MLGRDCDVRKIPQGWTGLGRNIRESQGGWACRAVRRHRRPPPITCHAVSATYNLILRAHWTSKTLPVTRTIEPPPPPLNRKPNRWPKKVNNIFLLPYAETKSGIYLNVRKMIRNALATNNFPLSVFTGLLGPCHYKYPSFWFGTKSHILSFFLRRVS